MRPMGSAARLCAWSVSGIVLALLGGCTEVPILKTNCWSSAGGGVTASTMSMPQGAAQVTRAVGDATALFSPKDADASPCR